MIVIDEEESQSNLNKTQFSPVNSRPEETTALRGEAPPAYTGRSGVQAGSSAAPQPQPIVPPMSPNSPVGYQAQVVYPYPHPHANWMPPPPPPVRRGPPAGKRFLMAFVIGVAIWLLFSALVSSIVDLAAHTHGTVRWRDIRVGRQPTFEGAQVISCVGGSKATPYALTLPANEENGHPIHVPSNAAGFFSAETIFSTTLPPAGFSIFNRGNGVWGKLIVEEGDSANITFLVAASSITRYGLDKCQVCLTSRHDGGLGLALTTSSSSSSIPYSDYANFDVRVKLPRTSASDPLTIGKFHTDLSTFRIEGSALENYNFDTVELRTSNAGVRFDDPLVGDVTVVTTSNGPIEGHFFTKQKLSLTTSNAAITVTAHLESNDERNPTQVNMRTSNAKINSEIYLANGHEISRGQFAVQEETTNGRIDTKFLSQPLDSVLNLSARTSNGPVSASLQPSFEGKYSVVTTNNVVKLVNKNPNDPSGKERNRNLNRKHIMPGSETGSVQWGRGATPSGSVHLVSTNSKVTLEI